MVRRSGVLIEETKMMKHTNASKRLMSKAARNRPPVSEETRRRMSESASKRRTAKSSKWGRAYIYHRGNAKKRDIPWEFTPLTWLAKWVESGHWLERGTRRGQYCMHRPGDVGPYGVGVEIIAHAENARLGQLGKPKPTLIGNKHTVGKTPWNKGRREPNVKPAALRMRLCRERKSFRAAAALRVASKEK